VSKDEYVTGANRMSVQPTNLSPSALGVGFLPDLEAHLLEFLLNKRVVLVTPRMQSSEGGQRLFFSADNHQPTGRKRRSYYQVLDRYLPALCQTHRGDSGSKKIMPARGIAGSNWKASYGRANEVQRSIRGEDVCKTKLTGKRHCKAVPWSVW
jgi:hypothetical protein